MKRQMVILRWIALVALQMFLRRIIVICINIRTAGERGGDTIDSSSRYKNCCVNAFLFVENRLDRKNQEPAVFFEPIANTSTDSLIFEKIGCGLMQCNWIRFSRLSKVALSFCLQYTHSCNFFFTCMWLLFHQQIRRVCVEVQGLVVRRMRKFVLSFLAMACPEIYAKVLVMTFLGCCCVLNLVLMDFY